MFMYDPEDKENKTTMMKYQMNTIVAVWSEELWKTNKIGLKALTRVVDKPPPARADHFTFIPTRVKIELSSKGDHERVIEQHQRTRAEHFTFIPTRVKIELSFKGNHE